MQRLKYKKDHMYLSPIDITLNKIAATKELSAEQKQEIKKCKNIQQLRDYKSHEFLTDED